MGRRGEKKQDRQKWLPRDHPPSEAEGASLQSWTSQANLTLGSSMALRPPHLPTCKLKGSNSSQGARGHHKPQNHKFKSPEALRWNYTLFSESRQLWSLP